MPHRTAGTARSTRAVRPFDARTSRVWVSIGIPRPAAPRRARPRGAIRWELAPSRRSRLRRKSPLPGPRWMAEPSLDARRVRRPSPSARAATAGGPRDDRATADRPRGRRRAGRRRPRRCRDLGGAVLGAEERSSAGTAPRSRGEAGRSCRTEKWIGAIVGIRRSPSSIPAVGPVTKPVGCAAQSTDAALLERRSGRRRRRTRLCRPVAARQPRTSRTVVDATDARVLQQRLGRDHTVVIPQPMPGGIRECRRGNGHARSSSSGSVEGMSVSTTVRKGCAAGIRVFRCATSVARNTRVT